MINLMLHIFTTVKKETYNLFPLLKKSIVKSALYYIENKGHSWTWNLMNNTKLPILSVEWIYKSKPLYKATITRKQKYENISAFENFLQKRNIKKEKTLLQQSKLKYILKQVFGNVEAKRQTKHLVKTQRLLSFVAS